MTLKNTIKLKAPKERRLKMKIEFKVMNSIKGRLLAVILLLLSVACLTGLNTAVSHAQTSFAIDYLASTRSHTATMQVNQKAEVVWQNVVDLAKKRNPNLTIKEENKKKLKFEATKKTKSGETLWGSVKVRPLSDSSCRLIFTATMGGGKPLEKEMKEFVQDTLLQYCDEMGMKCNVVK
jgi:hypothetical protein